MPLKCYTFLGWIVWQLGSRLVEYKLADNRAKVGAVGVIAAVLIGGALAAKGESD
jgi:hypothetical protein